MSMIITDVLGYSLSSPYGSGNSLGQPLGVKSIGLVEVHTDAGIVGFGETYCGVYAPELIEPCATFWKRSMVSQDPLDYDLAQQVFLSAPFINRSGLLSSVFSAIEMALWDIRGKAAGEPVYRLLNSSQPRQKVKVYASGGSAALTPDQLKEDLRPILDQGFDSYKMRVGYQDWARDLERVGAARRMLGDSNELMIDAIMGTLKPPWDLQQAVRKANDLSQFRPVWLEEPLHPANLQDHIPLKESSPIPIASGEALTGFLEFAAYLNSNAIDILQPDVTHCGGYEIARRVVELAGQRNVRLACHVWGSALAFAANAHFALAFPSVEYLEVPMVPLEISDHMLTAPVHLKEGYLIAPDEPGLGVHVTADLKERYKLVLGSGYRI